MDKTRCRSCRKKKETGPKSPYCVACAIKRSVKNAKQLRDKKGAFYDKWLESMHRFAVNIGVE